MGDIKKVVPVGDNVLVKVEVAASKSGILLSDSAKETSERTLVAVRCGPDVKHVHEGDLLTVNMLDFRGELVHVTDDFVLVPERVVVAIERA